MVSRNHVLAVALLLSAHKFQTTFLKFRLAARRHSAHGRPYFDRRGALRSQRCLRNSA